MAAPFPAFTLLLVRALSAIAAALVPVSVAALIVPGPRWLPIALLLPSLALCAFALAAVTVVGPHAAATLSAAVWAGLVLLVGVAEPTLAIVQWHGQAVYTVVLVAAIAVLFRRHDRFEFGWTR